MFTQSEPDTIKPCFKMIFIHFSNIKKIKIKYSSSPVESKFSSYFKPAKHEAFLSVCNLEACGVEMTSLLAVFQASLLDLKDRTCSLSRLGPGKPAASSKQRKNY